MSNSFAFIVMLTAAQDILSPTKNYGENDPLSMVVNATIDVDQCEVGFKN